VCQSASRKFASPDNFLSVLHRQSQIRNYSRLIRKQFREVDLCKVKGNSDDDVFYINKGEQYKSKPLTCYFEHFLVKLPVKFQKALNKQNISS